MKHVATACSFVLLFGLIPASPVLAAAPGNDTYASRTVIPGLPFTDTVDTTEATTDSDDSEIYAQCAPAGGGFTVWYEYTTPTLQTIFADASASNYETGVIVATGAPGTFHVVACGLGQFDAVFTTDPGETYTILVLDDGPFPETGGTLVISVDVLPPPEVAVTLDSTGTFDLATGEGTLSATVVCMGAPASLVIVDASVEQRRGSNRVTAFGGFGIFGCADEVFRVEEFPVFPHAPYPGPLRGGPTSVTLEVMACGFVCVFDVSEERVLLRR